MTRCGATLDDVPRRVSWRALASFARHLDMSSALMCELHPDAALWQGTARVPTMLADIYDLVAAFRSEAAAHGTGRRPRKPKPYPRPGAKGAEGSRRIGSGAIPLRDFDEWWEVA